MYFSTGLPNSLDGIFDSILRLIVLLFLTSLQIYGYDSKQVIVDYFHLPAK